MARQVAAATGKQGQEDLLLALEADTAAYFGRLGMAREFSLRAEQSAEQSSVSDEAKAVVRRSTEEVQGRGRFEVFDELFADDFVDYTTQPGTGMTPDKAGVRKLHTFPDFRAEIHWQLADGDRVTTYKTYCGTHHGTFLGIAPTHRKVISNRLM